MPGPKNHLGKHIMGAVMSHDKDVHDLLVKTLEQHDEYTAQKIAETLAAFHGMYVEPLRKQIMFLAQPWYRRAWIRFKYERHKRKMKKVPLPEIQNDPPAHVNEDTFRVHQPTEPAAPDFTVGGVHPDAPPVRLVDRTGKEFIADHTVGIGNVGN